MSEGIEKFLGLDNLKITNVTEDEDVYGNPLLVVECNVCICHKICPNCVSHNIYRDGYRQRSIQDLPILGKNVLLKIDVPKYVCNDCNTTFQEQLSFVESRNRITNRLKEHLAKASLNNTYDRLAVQYNISPTTIMNCFKDWVNKQDEEKSHCLYAPQVLGIDECHLAPDRSKSSKDGMRGVFVDILEGKVIEITNNRKKDTIINTINSMQNLENLKVVTTDMYTAYREAVYDIFGDSVMVVVDHYHVIQLLMEKMRECRKLIYENLPDGTMEHHKNNLNLLKSNIENFDDEMKIRLNQIFKAVPEIQLLFALKESFRTIYNCKTRSEAEEAFNIWKQQIPTNDESFKPMVTFMRTVDRWHKEIFNFFDCNRVSNASTEAINGIIKKINRAGNGYTFEVLRAKILYGAGQKAYTSIKKLRENRSTNSAAILNFMSDFTFRNFYNFDTEKHFGVSLELLKEELERLESQGDWSEDTD